MGHAYQPQTDVWSGRLRMNHRMDQKTTCCRQHLPPDTCSLQCRSTNSRSRTCLRSPWKRTSTTSPGQLVLVVLLLGVSLYLPATTGHDHYYASSSYCQPCPESCSCPLAYPAIWMCSVQCAGQNLTTFPSALPSGSLNIRQIDLSNNQIESLPEDAFQGLNYLNAVSLGGNPWLCNCSSRWLQSWLVKQEANGLVLDTDSILCAEPLHLAGRRLLSLHPYILCGPQEFVSCQWNSSSTPGWSVLFTQASHSTQTEEDCHQFCRQDVSQEVYVFAPAGADFMCYCGQRAEIVDPDFLCDCPGLLETAPGLGSVHCGKLYWTSRAVTSGLSLPTLHPVSTEEPADFSVHTSVSAVNYSWSFSDCSMTSDPWKTVKNNVTHNYVLSGTYELEASVTSESGRVSRTAVPVTVLDPVKVDNASEWRHLLATDQQVDIGVVVQQGSQLTIRWERLDQDGHRLRGRSCGAGWIAIGNKCLSLHRDPLEFSAAVSTCQSQDSTLLSLENALELHTIISSGDIGGESYFTAAHKSGDVYVWEHSQQVAYFTPADLSGSADPWDCVTVSDTGLLLADCANHQPFICQKDASVCVHGGVEDTQTDQCYLLTDSAATWQTAQNHCQQMDGHLASLDNADQSQFMADLLNAKSITSAWIGLHSVGLHPEGQFLWGDGEALGLYQPWGTLYPTPHSTVPGAGCVVMTADGDWQDVMCDSLQHYVCQYPAAGTLVKVERFAAGVTTFLLSNVAPLQLEAVQESSDSGHERTLYLMPGTSFLEDGEVQRWDLQTADIMSPTELHLQVYRPSCPQGYTLIQPGCSELPSVFATCLEDGAKVNCDIIDQPHCEPGLHYCPLLSECVSSLQPCTCNYCDADRTGKSVKSTESSEDDISVGGSADDQHCSTSLTCSSGVCLNKIHTFGRDVPLYTLVAEIVIALGDTSSRQLLTVSTTDFKVETGDIVGFQYNTDSNPVLCETSVDSVWRQSMLTVAAPGWNLVGQTLPTVLDYTHVVDNTVCNIRVAYTNPVTLTPPQSISSPLTLQAGQYTYKARLTNAISSIDREFHVVMGEPVRGLGLLYPSLTTPRQSPGSLGSFVAESGTAQTFLTRIDQGGDAVLALSLSDTTVVFTEECPPRYALIPDCVWPVSGTKFAVQSHTFDVSRVESTVVSLSAANRLGSQTITVDVLVQERIEGLSIKVQPAGLVELGDTVQFQAVLEHGTHVDYVWQISHIQGIAGTNSSLSYTFNRVATYSISVSASNGINQQHSTFELNVYKESNVRDLELTAPPTVLINTDVGIGTSLVLDHMSIVFLLVDFGDDSPLYTRQLDKLTGMDLTMYHTYDNVGAYTILTSVWDNITDTMAATAKLSITAVPPVSSVVAFSEHPFALTNTAVVFGSHVTPLPQGFPGLSYTWDFGDGSPRVETSKRFVTHQFTRGGQHTVTLAVSNQLQVVNSSIQQHIEEPVDGLYVTYDGPTVLSNITTITAHVSAGTSILYEFTDMDMDSAISSPQSEPSIRHQFTETGGHNVSVHAYNNISSVSVNLVVYVIDGTVLLIVRVDSPSVVETGVPVKFAARVVHAHPDALLYQWDFGDKVTSSGTDKATVDHRYSQLRTFTVSLTVQGGQLTQEFSKEILVQERIADISITGNLTLGVEKGDVVEGLYEVHMVKGSDAVFTWNTDNHSVTTTVPTHTLLFSSPGLYPVIVTTSNNISSEEMTFEVSVQEVISGLAILGDTEDSKYLSTEGTYSFVAVPLTGSDMIYTWTLNDSNIGSQRKLVHQFPDVDTFRLTCTASNDVNRDTSSIDIMVEQPIQDLRVQTNVSDSSTSLAVRFLASSQGTGAQYSWLVCSLHCTETTTDELSEFVYIFPVYDVYQVSVTAHNHISTATKQTDVVLIEHISGLSISLDGAASGGYSLTQKTITFHSELTSGTGVNYLWTLVANGEKTILGSESSLTYTFTTPGHYLVELSASNSVNEQHTSVRIQVVEEIQGLSISVSRHHVLVGEHETFRAAVTQGSGVVYDWTLRYISTKLDNWTQSIHNGGDLFNYTFPEEGAYEVKVTGHNVASSQNASVLLLASDSEDDLEIVVDCESSPYVPSNENLKFTVEPKQSSSSHLWLFSDDLTTYSSPVVHHRYEEVGEYTVVVMVTEDDSKLTDIMHLFVLEEIVGLELSCRPDTHCAAGVVALGEQVTYEATTKHGTSLTYLWRVDGELELESNTTSVMLYTFHTIGEHKVEVTAVNPLGEMVVSQPSTIMERIRDLGFNTSSSDSIFTREEVQFEAFVEAGSHLSYYWTLHTLVPLYFEGSSFTHTFLRAGTYDVELTAGNALGNETVLESINVQEDISSVTIESEPEVQNIYEGSQVVFSATVQGGGDDLQYNWTLWSVGELFKDTETAERFAYLFETRGTYMLTLNVSNEVSWDTDTKVFLVKKLNCDAPVLTPLGGTMRTEQKSRSVNFEVDVLACNQYQVLHKWVLHHENCTEENKMWLPFWVVTDKPQLVLPPLFLDYGNYCLLFSTEYDRTFCKSEVEIELEIVTTELKALIDGGSVRFLAGNQEIVLDGTDSYDPDTSTSSMVYLWTCAERGDVDEAVVEASDLDIQDWMEEIPVDEQAPGCFPPQNTSIVVLPPDTFEPGKMYTVTLSVMAANRPPQNTSQLIVVRYVDMPVVSIDCVSCRELNMFAVSSGQNPKLLGNCTNCKGHVLYEWKVMRRDGQNLVHIVLDETTTTTGAYRSNLVIRKGVLEDHHQYAFTLRVEAQEYNHPGTSSLILKSSPPPSGGTCSLPTLPANGTIVALEDTLQVSCHDWVDNSGSSAPLIFHVYVQKVEDPDTWYSAYRGPTNFVEFFLAPFEEDVGGGPVLVLVDVIDQLGNEVTALNRSVMVALMEPPANVSMTGLLASTIWTDLPRLTNRNNPKHLMQYVVAASLLLNIEASQYTDITEGNDPDLDIQRATRVALRRELLTTLRLHTSVSTIDDEVQVAYALQLLTTYSKEFPIGEYSFLSVTSMLKQIVYVLSPHVSQGWMSDVFVPIYSITTVNNLLEIIYLEIALQELPSPPPIASTEPTITVSSNKPNSSPTFSSLLTVNPPTLPSTRPTVNPIGWISKKMVQSVVDIGDDFVYLSLLTQVAEEDPILFVAGILHAEAMRVKAGNIRGVFQNSDCEVYLHDSLLDDLDESDEVLQVMSSMLTNPFKWGYHDQNAISSMTVSVSFTHINKSVISVSNLDPSEAIHIEVPNQEVVDTFLNFELGKGGRVKRGLSDLPPITEVISNVTAPDPEKLVFDCVVLSPGESTSTPLNMTVVTSGGAIHIMVIVDFFGEDEKGDTQGLSVDAYVGADYEPSSDLYNYSMRVTADMMEDLDNFTQYTLFILDKSSSVDVPITYYLTLVNNAASSSVNVSVGVYVSQCKFYNTSREIWETTGCVPSEFSTTTRTRCHCTHLTMFGASVLVSPAQLNFITVVKRDVDTNPIVLITVLMLALLYGCAVLMGMRWDMLALRRISFIPLCGRDGPYKYEVMVITGRRKGAGTSAHVGLRLFGEEGRTPGIHLHMPGAFQRNSQDQVLVAAETELGELWKVNVWHDNTGLSPDWYLARIIIRDLQTNKKYYFLLDDWLSVDDVNGGIKRDIFAAGAKDLSKFKTVFSAETSRGMVERHLWVSVVERPARTAFTRVQRATVCITALYMYLMANALWYGVWRSQSEMEELTATIVFTWKDAVFAIMAAIVIFPLVLGLIVLFKKTKPRRDPLNLGPKPGSAQTVEMEAWIDVGSRPSSATTIRPNREVFEMDDIEGPDRESTLESMPTRGRGLRRTRTFARIPRRDSVLSDTASWATTVSGDIQKYPQNLPPDERMWSYDSILTWPERLPQWEDGQGSAGRTHKADTDSGVTSDVDRQRNGQGERRRSVSLDRKHCRRISTDTFDEALQRTDEALCGTNNTESKGTPPGDSPLEVIEETGQRSEEKGQKFNPRDEAMLQDLEEPGVYVEELPQVDSTAKMQRRGRSWSAGSSMSAETTFTSGKPGVTTSSLTPGYPSVRQRSWSTTSDSIVMAAETLPPEASSTKDKCHLPYWCVYLAYSLCLVICICCVSVTLAYGFEFDTTVSLYWLLACFLSFLQSALILEPVKVLVVAVLIAAMGRALDDTADNIETTPVVEANEKIKEVKMKPMGGYALLQAKEENLKLSRMHLLLRQFVAYFLFLFLVMTINYAAYDRWSYYLRLHQHNIFTTQMYDGHTRGYYDIDTQDDYWDWLEQIGAPAIHLEQGSSIAMHGYLVGRPRLRQVRSTEVSCSAKDPLLGMSADHLLTQGCYGNNGWDEDTQSYSEGWSNNSNHTWTYTKNTGSSSMVGSVSTYSGGGYIQELGLTYLETLNIIQGLRQDIWIDRGTRAVFLEFSLYNANMNLYGVVNLLVEFALSGGSWPSETMEAIRLFKFEAGFVVTLTIFMCLLSAVFLYLLLHITYSIRLQGRRYFRKFWNWIELTLATLTLCSIAIYIHTVLVHSDASHAVRVGREVYVALTDSVYWSRVWRYLNAVLLFLLMLVIVNQLRFIKWLSKYGRTLRAASGKIMGCLLLFMLLTVGYAMLGYLWYGTTVYAYRGVPHAMVTMVGMLKGYTPFFERMVEVNKAMAFIILFTISFVSLTYLAVFGLILAALSDSYRTVKQQMFYHNTLDTQDFEMVNFTMRRFKRWIGITKPKPAFRRVKFQGLQSLSSHSTTSHSGQSWAPASSDSSGLEVLDEEGAAIYLESLLDRAVPTWHDMLDKLDQVADLQDEEAALQLLEDKFNQLQTSKQKDTAQLPPLPPQRSRSLSVTNMEGKPVAPPRGERRLSVSSDTTAVPKRPPRRKRSDSANTTQPGLEAKEVWK